MDEQMAAEAEAPKPSTTVTTYTVGLTDESAKAARWSLNKLGGTDDWTLTGLFYPGCDDSDAIGGTVTHHLTDGNSSFPLRGVISCTKSISSVTVEVKVPPANRVLPSRAAARAIGLTCGSWINPRPSVL